MKVPIKPCTVNTEVSPRPTKGRWLPISLSPETDCNCGALIILTPPRSNTCTLTDSSNTVACYYKGGIWGETIQLSITFSTCIHTLLFAPIFDTCAIIYPIIANPFQ